MFSSIWRLLAPFNQLQQALEGADASSITFSEVWHVLGPFQIGTREAQWGSDPLETLGGFHHLEYDPTAVFASSLGFNGTVRWSNIASQPIPPSIWGSTVDLSIDFPHIDWRILRDVYGWPARQWQGWTRGEILVQTQRSVTVALHAENIIEFWVDDTHYFGGDFYNYYRAPVTLRLDPGVHRIDVRLVRDVRAVGGIGEASVEVRLRLEGSSKRPQTMLGLGDDVLMPDVVGGDFGSLTSPFGSVTVRNDAEDDVYILSIEAMPEMCRVELCGDLPLKLVPGQTRPIGFRLGCAPSFDRQLEMTLMYRSTGSTINQSLSVSVRPRVLEGIEAPQRVTFLHPSGIVSYAALRPPAQSADCGNHSLPVILVLHGAGTDVDRDGVKNVLDPVPNLCAWAIFPTGGTTWSGDDWHNWGLADAEAAVATIPDWIEQIGWQGPGVNIDRWLVVGHSNGGQGTYHVVTHRPDKIFAAAALSGYSSIPNYIPYSFWRTADTGRTAVVSAALNSYRHELLLENAQGIPILQQHGTEDDNVPVFHSRLLHQRLQQAGADSTFFELPGKPHWWSGVMTTSHLRKFYDEQLALENSPTRPDNIDLRNFSIVTANPGDMGPKNGVSILRIIVPAQISRLDIKIDLITSACLLTTANVEAFSLPVLYKECSSLIVDGCDISITEWQKHGIDLFRSRSGWGLLGEASTRIPPVSERHGRQLGPMNVMLNTRGSFQIVEHSSQTRHTALQISRILTQYFNADTVVQDDYEAAFSANGNVISVAIGGDLPVGLLQSHPIEVKGDQLLIHDRDGTKTYTAAGEYGLAALYLRPLRGERLELVVWAIDERSLEIVARLAPMMTGTGQPDFIIADRRMLSTGLDAVLALGFFGSTWEVSRNSFLS